MSDYDIDNPVPASRLRESSLLDFFQLVAHRSGVALDSFDCITFRYKFICLQTEVIYKDDSDERWEKLKDDMKQRHRICGIRFPDKTDFDVLVDPGNTTIVKVKEEDLSGL